MSILNTSRLDYLQHRNRFAALLDLETHTVEWLDDEVFSGRIHCIADGDSAVLVSVKTYPTGVKEVHGEAAIGDIGVIVSSLIPAAECWGREQGCTFASIASREGWAKALAKHGYTPHQITIRKAI